MKLDFNCDSSINQRINFILKGPDYIKGKALRQLQEPFRTAILNIRGIVDRQIWVIRETVRGETVMHDIITDNELELAWKLL